MLHANLGTQVHGICVWVKTHYGVNKKLSQFDSFLYSWNFDISWWMFGKHFVNKKFN
jgi:hypothetical protein